VRKTKEEGERKGSEGFDTSTRKTGGEKEVTQTETTREKMVKGKGKNGGETF